MSKVHTVNRTIQRATDQRTNKQDTIDGWMSFWKSQLSRNMGLHVNIKPRDWKQHPDTHKWLMTWDLTITREDKSSKPINEVRLDALIDQLNVLPKWNKYRFIRCEPEGEGKTWWNPDKIDEPHKEEGDHSEYRDIIPFDAALTWEEFDSSPWEHLISASDEEVECHEAFQGLFDRAAHIRIILGTIHHAIMTKGAVRNHCLAFGSAGAAKTTMIEAILKLFPENAYVKFHADSATSAGFRKMFLKTLREVGIPPLLVIEECDKVSDPHTLAPFLSVLDRRGTLQQTNARYTGKVNAPVLCLATGNNKEVIDKMLSGALVSRFAKQLYVPLPGRNTLERILAREIETFGGKREWVIPAIDLAEELGVGDPRTVISYLDGRDRLLDGTYRRDILMTTMATAELRELRREEQDEIMDQNREKRYLKSMDDLRRNGYQSE